MGNQKPIKILRWPQLKERISYSKNYLLTLENAGKFPKRVKLTERAVGWVEQEIEDWLQERVAARERKAAA